jgi:beta-1,4-mannosyltransferase
MQYHALSLASQAGQEVHVVAFAGAAPCAAVASCAAIRLHALPSPPALLSRLPRALALPLKALLQLLSLLYALLWRTPFCSTLLLQTPPCIPTFAACQLACALRGARLVCDWHNFGYTLLALSLPPRSLLLRLAERYERALGRRCHAHLCVTQAMADELASPSWGVPSAVVLRDRPAAQFVRCDDVNARHSLFVRIAPLLVASAARCAGDWLAREEAGACCSLLPVPCHSLADALAQTARSSARPSRCARPARRGGGRGRACARTAPLSSCASEPPPNHNLPECTHPR